MSLSEEYLTSFTFSIFLEDITSELQLKRRYSEQIDSTPTKIRSAKLSISTLDSLNNSVTKSNRFTLSKFCPHFENFTPNGKFLNLQCDIEKEKVKSVSDNVKNRFYENLTRKVTKMVERQHN